MTDKQVPITNFLTLEEIAKAAALYKVAPQGMFARRCAAEIIRPVIDRIDKALGQKNSALYLAYCVEWVLDMKREYEQRGTKGSR